MLVPVDRPSGYPGAGNVWRRSRRLIGVRAYCGVCAVRILGIVAKTHDSGLALLNDGVPELVLEEERYNRSKKTKKFPKLSLAAAFAELGLGDQRHRCHHHALGRAAPAPDLLRSSRSRFPLSLALLAAQSHTRRSRTRSCCSISYLAKGLRRRISAPASCPPIVNVGHHDSHAAMFFASPFEEALVLVMDGYGDDSSSSAYVGRGNRLERHWSTSIMNSVGPGLHLRHRVPGLCRLRRRGQGDGAGGVRRATPTSSASAT